MSNKDSKAPRMMGGPGRSKRPQEKAKDFKGTMLKLWDILKQYRLKVFIVLFFAIGSTIFSIIGPKILGNATTLLAEGMASKFTGGLGIDFEGIAKILLFLTAIYALSAVFGYIQNWIMSGITQKIAFDLRNDLVKKMNVLPFSYYDKTTRGEVLSRVTNDIQTITSSLNQSLQQVLSTVVQVIGILIMMLTISWQLTLMAIVIVPISAILVMLIVKKSQPYFLRQQNTLAQVNGHVEEMYGGHLVMKAFNGEEQSIDTFVGLNDSLYDSAWKSQFLSGLMQPVTGFIGNIGYVGVVAVGGVLAINGSLVLGDIQAFMQYIRTFNQQITQSAQVMNTLQSTAAAAERVFEFLAEPEEVKETEHPVAIKDDKGNDVIEGNVVFENVRFGYEKDKVVIHNFSASVKAGQRIAIVGPTGAGKTTIVKLLMRFYDINDGAIYIDGHNIKDFTRHDLRNQFGMVLQDAWLHSGTIMENIRYGNLEATDEEVIAAADAAYVDHFIRTLENGYETVIDEETTNISQGQRQLLTIARAFLKQPKILILDEATSSVDTRTEVLIQKGMENLLKGRTSFVIAHRLSTIRNADLILVMKDGDIVEVGNHEQLLADNGFYATLYNSQFED